MKFPTAENSALVMIDMQLKLLPVMLKQEKLIDRCKRMVESAGILGVDVIVTEQYPKGLGVTAAELTEVLPEGTPVISKTAFSVFGSAEFCRQLESRKREVLIFCGIETGICLLQSVLEARERGYEVIVVSDAVSGRDQDDCNNALDVMRRHGAMVLSSDSVLFMYLRDAASPDFKAVSKLIK